MCYEKILHNNEKILEFQKLSLYIHCVPGVSGLGQKYAFIKQSAIFTRSLLNFDQRSYSWRPYFDKVS